MKFFIAFSFLTLSFALSAATNPQDCLKQKKNLDRRYCLDSYLETVKETYDADRKAMANGIPTAAKEEKITMTEQELQAKRDYLNLVKTEIEMQEKYLEDVRNAKVATTAAPAAPVEQKKKKKHHGFRIKL